MSKLRYSELKEIEQREVYQLENNIITRDELEKVAKVAAHCESLLYELGYFTPSYANWSYRCYIAMIDGQAWKLYTHFGQLDHAHKTYIIRNINSETLESE